MREVLSLDFIDPYPLVIRRVRKPDPLDAWFATVSPEVKVVADKPAIAPLVHRCACEGQLTRAGATHSKSRCSDAPPEPVVAAPDGGTWVAAAEPPEVDGVYRIWDAEGDTDKWWCKWLAGRWGICRSEEDAADESWYCEAEGNVRPRDRWLKPSAPQSSGADEWIEIKPGDVLPDLGRGEFELKKADGKIDGVWSLALRVYQVDNLLACNWTHYRRITKQWD